jgi:D-alanine-D-alanine ligase
MTGRSAARTTTRRRLPASRTPVVLLTSVDPDWSAVDLQDAAQNEELMRAGLAAEGHPVEVVRVTTAREIAGALQGYDPDRWIIFNWCESFAGIANGYWLVPPVLERLGFTYTGSDTGTLRITQSKPRTMRALARAGVPVPEWKTVKSAAGLRWNRFPAILKPAEEHCSFGITRDSVVFSEAEAVARAGQLIEQFKQPVVISDYLTGREFNVAIWGNGVPAVLPLHELDFSAFTDPRDRLCSYDAKWVPGSEHWDKIPSLCPAPVRGRLKRRTEEVALAAYQVMGLRDYGRIDMRERDGEVYVIDVNANCDITIIGGFARSARVAGYDYGAAIARIIALAAVRRAAAKAAAARAYEHELTPMPDVDHGLLTPV